jgi:hypothetical protein
MAGQILQGLHRSGYCIVDFPCAGDEFATVAITCLEGRHHKMPESLTHGVFLPVDVFGGQVGLLHEEVDQLVERQVCAYLPVPLTLLQHWPHHSPAAACTRGSRTDAECSAISATSMRRLSRELGRSAMAAYWYVEDKQLLMSLVALHADEIPDQEHHPDNLEDAVARQLPHLERLRGRDFFPCGVDTIIAGLHTRLEAKSKA